MTFCLSATRRALALTSSAMAAPQAKAQSVILVWLEGGISHLDSWDVKGNSGFRPIATNATGVQVSEIFPGVAKHMDKLSIIRSMKSDERNHPQGTIQTLTGHRPNPALKFPSFGSIVSKELGLRNNMPPFAAVPMPTEGDFFNYQEAYQAAFIGSEYDAMILPDPSKPDFQLPNLNLPKSVSAEAINDRRTMLSIVDRHFRQKEELAEFAKMDAFQEQALKMLLDPRVKQAFDLSRESEKTKDQYGRHRVGQSVLLARRLVEAGCRFVTAAGYKHGQWDTHDNNEERLRGTLAPLLDQSLSALMEDLKQRGLLESTVVLVTGEFGRTPVINPKGGRDHWPDCCFITSRWRWHSWGPHCGRQRQRWSHGGRQACVHRRSLRHGLQGSWNRLDQNLHVAHCPAHLYRQRFRRHSRESPKRALLARQ